MRCWVTVSSRVGRGECRFLKRIAENFRSLASRHRHCHAPFVLCVKPDRLLGVGMLRCANDALASAISTILPRYITITRRLMCSTTTRSCAMKRYAMAALLLQILEQIDDLCLHRNVQRAHRFIAND